MTRRSLRLVFVLAMLAHLGRASADEGPTFDGGALEFFEKQVRPVLADRCQSCHGDAKQKGGLRLDSRDAVLRGGDNGPAAVPGRAAESLLVSAIGHGDDLQMPPKSKLPKPEIQALTKWVDLGLPWPPAASPRGAGATPGPFDLAERKAAHWAWQPITSPTPPAVSDSAWPLGRIDRFLLAKLDAKSLKPAPDADRRTLIRRLSFDLIGLPPTPEEVAAFLADNRPDAVERVVDRLLGSPHFGERWARHWLDLVRYAETRGHEFDPEIPNAWRYRDYVVRALNADVPYDAFVTEHLAGDLVSPPRRDPASGANESILGTGFWFLGEEVHSPVDVRQDETDRLDNRLDVMTKTFLGLTVACARCHDHKFDAITQRDYYGLAGFLISSNYRQARFATVEAEQDVARRLRAVDDAARPRLLALAAKVARSSLDLASMVSDRGPTEVASYDSTSIVVDFGAVPRLDRMQDGAAFGPRPLRPGDLLAGPGKPGLNVLASARRDPAFAALALAEGTERDHGRLGTWDRPGQTLRTPEFTIKSGRLWYLARGAGRAYASVNSHTLIAGPLHGAILTEWTDGGKEWRWVRHDLSAYKGNRAHVEFTPSGPADLAVALVIDAENEPPPPNLAHRSESPTALIDETLRRMEQDRLDDSPAHAALAARIWKAIELDSSAARELKEVIEAWSKARAEAAAPLPRTSPTAPALMDGNGVDEHVLIRGSSKRPANATPRRFLEAVDGPAPLSAADGGSGRLELARRIVDRNDPFAARVAVNRVWHHLMGRGIVPSVDNFGVLGEPPSHPELLDFLADGFIRDGWSLKRLIRSVVLTRAYSMSSRPEQAADQADPENRLWHRASLRRLEAEPIRDAVLAVSGRLDRRMEGPSVPVHLTGYMQGRGRPGKSGPLEGDGRRSLYLEIRRNFLAPMMLAFDAPIPFTTMGRRNVSNVPAQALILLNDPFVVAEAQHWADRTLDAPGLDAAGRVSAMYEAAFARPPTAEESAAAVEFVGEQARERGSMDEAWADLAHVLINAKEFIFIP